MFQDRCCQTKVRLKSHMYRCLNSILTTQKFRAEQTLTDHGSSLSQPCKVATSHLRITWLPGSPDSVLFNAHSQSWYSAELDGLSHISSLSTRNLDQNDYMFFLLFSFV